MRPPQGFEWLLILFIVVLLFGSKRLPDMARGIGRSLRILKAETRGLAEDDEAAGSGAGSDADVAKRSEISAKASDAPAQPQQQTQTDTTTP